MERPVPVPLPRAAPSEEVYIDTVVVDTEDTPNSKATPRTIEEWRRVAHKAEDDATELHNLIAERDSKIEDLERQLNTTKSNLLKTSTTLSSSVRHLTSTESQAENAITEAVSDLEQAQQEIARLKRTHKDAIDIQEERFQKAKQLLDSTLSDNKTLETKVQQLQTDRDTATAYLATLNDAPVERFADWDCEDPHGWLEVILKEVTPVLIEQDLDVTPENILSQFLRSQQAANIKRSDSDVSLDQQASHKRKDSHQLTTGRKVSLQHELTASDDDSENEDDLESDHLFEDTGAELYPEGEEFGQNPLTERPSINKPLVKKPSVKKPSIKNPSTNSPPIKDNKPVPAERPARPVSAPFFSSRGMEELTELKQQHDAMTEEYAKLKEAKSALEREFDVQATEMSGLRNDKNTLEEANGALKKKLEAVTAKVKYVTSEAEPQKATLWHNLSQLPGWMKALFLLLLSLLACLFFAAYQERKKWLDANDLSWEITPYDLGRGYSYGTGYNYDYGGGYYSNWFIRWLVDDVLQLTRTPYD